MAESSGKSRTTPTDERRRAFVRHYAANGFTNATQAAIAAGYSPKSARFTAHKLLGRSDVQQMIDQHRREAEQSAAYDRDRMLADLVAIATADPADLVRVRVGACRHCHGVDHQYQWRSPQEYQRHVTAWSRMAEDKRGPMPTDEGGYGYSHHDAPHPDCPECDGDGAPLLIMRDTPANHPLYAGAKATKYGIEIKMHDKLAAIDKVARIIGAYEEDNRQKTPGGDLGAFLLDMIRSHKTQGAVLNYGARYGDDEDEDDA